MIPTGKCYFVWMLDRCAGGDPLRLAAMAQEAGLVPADELQRRYGKLLAI